MILIPTKVIKGLLKVCNDVTRPHLLGIWIDAAGYAVATNGSALLAVRIPKFDNCLSYFASREQCEKVLKDNPKCSHHQLVADVQGDAKFPDWRRVVPKFEADEFSPFDVELVERVRKAVEMVSGRSYLGIIKHGRPGVMITPPDVLALVMPMAKQFYDQFNTTKHVTDFLGDEP